jgi:hypothetical protein
MTVVALVTARSALRAEPGGAIANVALPSAGAAFLITAMRKVRGRTRLADGFYPLVMLDPLVFARVPVPFDTGLVSAGLLALLAGAIIAMRHDRYLRYLVIALLAATLAAIAEMFIILLPPLIAWLLYAGYSLTRSKEALERTRGIAVLVAAEIGLVIFGLACILVEPTSSPLPASLFSTAVGFFEFPLLVIAIAMLALGWRKGPAGATPPYFSGMLALLLGLLGMLLNNFQAGTLPAPGADQTAVILCLLYTVFALHGPRRFQWLVPPILLVAAAMHALLAR